MHGFYTIVVYLKKTVSFYTNVSAVTYPQRSFWPPNVFENVGLILKYHFHIPKIEYFVVVFQTLSPDVFAEFDAVG